MREHDEDMLAIALGEKPKRMRGDANLEASERKELFSRGNTERNSIDIERVSVS